MRHPSKNYFVQQGRDLGKEYEQRVKIIKHHCWPCALLHCQYVQVASLACSSGIAFAPKQSTNTFCGSVLHIATLPVASVNSGAPQGSSAMVLTLHLATLAALQEWHCMGDPEFLHYCIPPKMKNNQSCRALVTRKII